MQLPQHPAKLSLGDMLVKHFDSIDDISPAAWNGVQSGTSPFLDHEFHRSLEKSGSVGEQAGWRPLYWTSGGKTPDAALFAYEKHHSYGEYIFDWDWANAYARMGVPYYPKLTSMIPFTPATIPHLTMPRFDSGRAGDLLDNFEERYTDGRYSSAHFLFLTEDEREFFSGRGYLLRDSLQYHFKNPGYKDFEEFLGQLKSRKAKQIRKERQFPKEITFETLTGDRLTARHGEEMYLFYLSTLEKKGAIPYLKQDFFRRVFGSLPERILYVRALTSGEPIAGALYFFDDTRLYGRYWGARMDYPCLHFELCCYRGIDFCIEKKLTVFESGAQGEHKIPRGFEPVKTYSAHKIKHPDFRDGIEKYILREREFIDRTARELMRRLPYRKAL